MTARLGRFTDENLTLTAALSGGEWAEAFPLVNLQDQSRFVTRPARQLNPGDPVKSRIDAALAAPRVVNLVGVMFHTLGLGAEYRLTAAAAGGSLDAPGWSSGWRPVWGRLFPSMTLAWEASNWWTGAPLAGDLDLFHRHLWIPLAPGFLAAALRLEFRDTGAAWFDIGGLWLAAAWSPTFNFDHGRELALDPRTVSEEAPAGRLFHEERTPRRRVTATWSALDAAEGYRLFDAGARAGVSAPVLFAPDAGDPVSLAREAWPATFERPPAPRIGRRRQTTVTATFREIIS